MVLKCFEVRLSNVFCLMIKYQRVLNEVYVFDNEDSYVIRQQLVLGSSTYGFQNRSVNKVYHHFTWWYAKKKFWNIPVQ
jgi:hypothetical protein